jgi:splicing factor 3B subunit 2
MGLSTAERNRRKRERKKREKEENKKQEAALKEAAAAAAASSEGKNEEEEVEIEYVAEPVLPPAVAAAASTSVPAGLPPGMGEDSAQNQPESMESVLRRFHQRAAVSAVVTDDERKSPSTDAKISTVSSDEEGDYDDEDDEKKPMSKRKLRELTRPSVAELKRRVKRPDLVEAHDITAADPDFLIHLKSVSGTVPVPRHWGRKRKYLQGKRGFEKPPFQVSQFSSIRSVFDKNAPQSSSANCFFFLCSSRTSLSKQELQRFAIP